MIELRIDGRSSTNTPDGKRLLSFMIGVVDQSTGEARWCYLLVVNTATQTGLGKFTRKVPKETQKTIEKRVNSFMASWQDHNPNAGDAFVPQEEITHAAH